MLMIMRKYLACHTVEKTSRKFASQLSTLLQQRFNLRIFTYFTSLKLGHILIKNPKLLLLENPMWYINLHLHMMRTRHILV